MRQIINISLPKSMAEEIDFFVKNGNYASKSEFIRSLVRNWSENKLATELKESQKQVRIGQKYVLKSFKDLRKL